MSLRINAGQMLGAPVPKPMLVLVLTVVVTLMIGCKNSRESGSSGAGGLGGSAGSNGSGSGSAAGDFEGVINMEMGSEGTTARMTYYLKTNRMRVESSLAGSPEVLGVTIMDVPAAKMTSLVPKQKAYFTMDLKGMQAETGKDTQGKFPKLTDTGKKETIAGYTCEHYLLGDEQNMDLCVTKGLGYFGMGGTGGQRGGLKDLLFSEKMKAEVAANPEWSKFLEGGAFPLKMTVTEGGRTTMTAEVTSVERKKVDDSLFTVPPDYKEMKLPGAMPPIPGKTTQ